MAKVKKITVTNLKAVSKLSADFNGCTAIITGGNNKGKTSFLRSLPERLRGNKPDLILKQGESDGQAEWELTTGEKFLWTFDGKKEKLTYVSDKDIPQAVTKSISQKYFPDIFDVDKFLNDAPAKQKATLQKISGLDFTEIDAKYNEAYDQRTYANKRVTETKAKLIEYDKNLPAEPIPSDDISEELNGIEAHNLRFDTINDKLKSKLHRISSITTEVLELEGKIKKLQDEKITLEDERKKGEDWLSDDKNKKKTNEAELKEKLSEIHKTNAKIEENNKAIGLQKEHDAAVTAANKSDELVKEIEQQKLDLIKSADMPDGFGFSDDGITYNGFPFNRDSLSSSGIYIGALKLAAKQLGEVKTLYFDASFLDKNSLQEIEKWANEEDLQLLMERPDFEGGEIEYQIVAS